MVINYGAYIVEGNLIRLEVCDILAVLYKMFMCTYEAMCSSIIYNCSLHLFILLYLFISPVIAIRMYLYVFANK